MGQDHIGGFLLPPSPKLPLPTPQAKGVEGPAARKGFVIVAGDSETGDYWCLSQAGDISICQVLVTTQ